MESASGIDGRNCGPLRASGVLAIAVSSFDAASGEIPSRSNPNAIDVFLMGAGSQTSGAGMEIQSSTRADIGVVNPFGMSPTMVYFSPSYSRIVPRTSGRPPYADRHHLWLIIAT